MRKEIDWLLIYYIKHLQHFNLHLVEARECENEIRRYSWKLQLVNIALNNNGLRKDLLTAHVKHVNGITGDFETFGIHFMMRVVFPCLHKHWRCDDESFLRP